MAAPPKRFLPKPHKFKSPVGYISLHEALNRLGCKRHADWGIDQVWKKHPYFFHDGRFERFVIDQGLVKCRTFKFKPQFEPRGKVAARTFVAAVTELSNALQLHDVVGYLVGSAHEPIVVPMQSVQWVKQERLIFSTGFMKVRNQRLQIIIWEDDFEKWLSPQKRTTKDFDVPDNAFITAVVEILNATSAANGQLRFTSAALWTLLRSELSRPVDASSFRTFAPCEA